MPPLRKAGKALQERLGDAHASVAERARFWNVEVGQGDLLWLESEHAPEAAGQVQAYVQGKMGPLLLCRRLRLLSWEPFGSRWALLAEEFLLQVTERVSVVVPAWWRIELDTVTCLH